jgi:hypothetical protein
LPGLALAAGDQGQADLLLIHLRAGQRQRPGRAVGGEETVQPKTPEEGEWEAQ